MNDDKYEITVKYGWSPAGGCYAFLLVSKPQRGEAHNPNIFEMKNGDLTNSCQVKGESWDDVRRQVAEVIARAQKIVEGRRRMEASVPPREVYII